MRRPRQHVMEQEAEQLIRKLLPSEWIIRGIEQDYGVDFEIELVDQDLVSGNRIWVQSKATERTERRTEEFVVDDENEPIRSEYVPYALNTKELFYALRCAFPLLLFLADLKHQDVFWVPLRDEVKTFLDPKRPQWRSQTTTTVRVPVRNSLRQSADDDYDHLRWFAKEPARMSAFVQIHWMVHEFSYKGSLDGYLLGNHVIHGGEESRLRQSLELARRYMVDALALDVLFDGQSGPFLFKAEQLRRAIDAADNALALLDTQQYLAQEMGLAIMNVEMGMSALESVSSCIEVWREQSVISPLAAVVHGN